MGGAISHRKGVGEPKSYDSTETLVLYTRNILYYTSFAASVVHWKENFFSALHKTIETGELFVVNRKCDEDRSSEAAMGGEGARSAPFGMLMSPKRRVRAAHGRARAAKTH